MKNSKFYNLAITHDCGVLDLLVYQRSSVAPPLL